MGPWQLANNIFQWISQKTENRTELIIIGAMTWAQDFKKGHWNHLNIIQQFPCILRSKILEVWYKLRLHCSAVYSALKFSHAFALWLENKGNHGFIIKKLVILGDWWHVAFVYKSFETTCKLHNETWWTKSWSIEINCSSFSSPIYLCQWAKSIMDWVEH